MAAERPSPTRAGAVLALVLTNPNATTAVRSAIASIAADAPRRGWDLPELAAVNVFALPHDDTTIVAAWCLAFPDQILRRAGYTPFGGPAVLPALLARTGQRRDALLSAAAIAGVPAAVVPDMAVPDLDDLAERGRAVRAHLLSSEAAFVTAHLHGPGAWSAYIALRPTFTGPLRELTATCATIAT